MTLTTAAKGDPPVNAFLHTRNDPLPIFQPAHEPLVVNWGLGVDSSAYLARILTTPDACGVDLERLVVITMMTGDEWPDTIADAERFLLPLLRRRSVRYVQIARAGQSRKEGVDVLDDSHAPRRIVPQGRWTLWEELETNGTVPQQANGRRLCSLHAKAEPGDDWIAAEFGPVPFTQVIGFNADEQGRAERDEAASKNPWRIASFPLIEWGWGRQRCEDFLYDLFKIKWKKSYCTFCCFPVSLGALPAHLDRMRANPQIASRVLRLEYTSMCLNPNSRLFGRKSLLEQFTGADPGDAAVLAAFENELGTGPWAMYQVRRILPVSGTDPAKRAPALRSVQRLGTGTHTRLGAIVRRRATEHQLRIEHDPYGSERVWLRERGPGYPAVEQLIVTAPHHVRDKEQDRFATQWAAHTGAGQLPTDT